MRDDFCVFILSHGRYNNVITYDTLQREGYTGKIYIVVDNEDSTVGKYQERFGDKNVIVFNKKEISKTFDTADTFDDRRTIVYARNACFDIAKKLGIRYFVQFDDDYVSFTHRFEADGKLKSKIIGHIDNMFNAMIDFLNDTGALTVAFAQGGDLLGGASSSNFKKRCLRKAMNSFFCDTEKSFQFVGRINEDVNTYTLLGQQGQLLLSTVDLVLNQKQTQANSGGMTDIYLDSGTYVKSFYSVIFCPSCVMLGLMGASHKRIHHKVDWDYCTPKIINEKWK